MKEIEILQCIMIVINFVTYMRHHTLSSFPDHYYDTTTYFVSITQFRGNQTVPKSVYNQCILVASVEVGLMGPAGLLLIHLSLIITMHVRLLQVFKAASPSVRIYV